MKTLYFSYTYSRSIFKKNQILTILLPQKNFFTELHEKVQR